jgi:hypothetical protein
MVDCPECGKRSQKEREGKNKYLCENEQCNGAFVLHPHEPSKTRIDYTGFARYNTTGPPYNEPHRRSIKQKLKLF